MISILFLRNLTLSLREGDWNHYVAALKETLPLFFAFDRTNYSRWGAIFYEDCLKLPIDYPNIYSEYIKGNFVVNFTSRKGSSVPLDDALEKSYNKTAKEKGLKEIYNLKRDADYRSLKVLETGVSSPKEAITIFWMTWLESRAIGHSFKDTMERFVRRGMCTLFPIEAPIYLRLRLRRYLRFKLSRRQFKALT